MLIQPTLQDFNHFRSDKRVAFKQEVVNGVDLTVISYMIADTDFWTLPHSLETRGITFETHTGKCISRPFQKFFNLGENAWSHFDNFDTTNYGFSVADKKDGSMLTPVAVDGKVFWKTKKSFYSDVAIVATDAAASIPRFNDICLQWCQHGYTPIFEFTSSQNRVVIDYGSTPTFTLLAVREVATGDYCFNARLHLLNLPPFPECVPNISTPLVTLNGSSDLERFIESVKTQRHIEGYVITAMHKERGYQQFKVKTQWYCDNHHVMTGLRERDIAEAVLHETVDDLKALVSATGSDVGVIEGIERRVVQLLSNIKQETELLAARMKHASSRKELAALHRANKYFQLSIRLYDGADPDYHRYFIKNHLKVDFSLVVVYNPTFSKDI